MLLSHGKGHRFNPCTAHQFKIIPVRPSGALSKHPVWTLVRTFKKIKRSSHSAERALPITAAIYRSLKHSAVS